ncbi:ankyrin repeat and protein kinase domain-containing protein 1-like isoform X1 [Glandiceps talaboti]
MAESHKILEIDEDKLIYDSIEPLGSGGFGAVYHATHKDWQMEVAVKQIVVQAIITESEKKLILEEARKLASVHHRNVVPLYGVCMTPKYYGLVMEYMAHGSLSSLLKQEGVPLSWPLRTKFLHETSQGMNFLHTMGSYKIYHMDLKTPNLLIDEHDTIKIADFGLSKVKGATKTKPTAAGGAGTVTHIPPEHLEDYNCIVTEKFDVFSFGVVMWEVLTREEPFKAAQNTAHVGIAILTGKRPNLNDVPHDAPEELKTLMTKCWNQDPKNRPYFSTILPKLKEIRQSLDAIGVVDTLSEDFLKKVAVKDDGTSQWSVKVIGQEGEGPTEFKNPWGLVWTPTGLLLVADYDNYRIQILNSDLQFVDSIRYDNQFSKPFKPFVIAVSRDNKYFIYDDGNKQIIVTNENKKIIRIICKNENLFGITLMGDYVLATDYIGHRLIKFTTMGDKVTEVKGEGKFNRPHSVVVTSDQKIVVSDCYNHRIKFYDSNLKFISSYYGSESSGHKLSCPAGLCIDKRNNIYICDHSNHRIVMVTEKKEFVVVHSDIEKPRFIAISEGKTTKIAVTQTNKHHITVLEL